MYDHKSNLMMYNISVIVPIYNVENYLRQCIDSLLTDEVHLEILLIDDGSDDSSGKIAEDYACAHTNIQVLHQSHAGPSAARNCGLDAARGEFIAFVDSDDWIAPGSLKKLYNKAKATDADMISGSMVHCHPNGDRIPFSNWIPDTCKQIAFNGKDLFVKLFQANVYFPMACGYIYNRSWIEKCHLRFDENIIHEDELWTQTAFCTAKAVYLTDIDYYYYRKRAGSITHTLKPCTRLRSLFHITDMCKRIADQYEFDSRDGEFKSWICTNIYRLYSIAYKTLGDSVRDSSFANQPAPVQLFDQICNELDDKAKSRCEAYLHEILIWQSQYRQWLDKPWNKQVRTLSAPEKDFLRIILVYNYPLGREDILSSIWKDFPRDYLITDDRGYLQQAYMVIFYIPELALHLEEDLEKPRNQYWVAWTNQSGENSPLMQDKLFCSLFDVQIIEDTQETEPLGITHFLQVIRQIDLRFPHPFTSK